MVRGQAPVPAEPFGMLRASHIERSFEEQLKSLCAKDAESYGRDGCRRGRPRERMAATSFRRSRALMLAGLDGS